MAAFEYKALDANGRQKKGVIEADSPRQVRQQLRDKQLMPVSVEQSTSNQNSEKPFSKLFKRAISVADLAMLTRQLSTLIGAGLPIEEALKATAEQTEKKRIQSMILSIRSKVLEGHSLANALNEYDYAFPMLYRATVAAGEHAGHLDTVLVRLADYMEVSQVNQQKIKLAAVYPIILCVVAIGIVVLLLTLVVPDIVEVFVKNGQELPTLTQVMINSSDFLVDHWIKLIIVFSGTIFGFLWAIKKDHIKKKYHHAMIHMPFIGKMVKGFNTSRFISTLAILNSSGVPLVEAMKIAGQVVGNVIIQEKLTVACQQVTEGGSLHQALKETGVFPIMMLHMIASGESSGELDSMLERTAKNQETDLQNTITTLVSMFEPIMLLVMGGVVVLIVIAIMLPILNMNQMIG
ncbi:GspF family T2SS innner membrane protein variant XcpS [Oceaniserpentilla sp. 4NH20-0058]|uniref:type II secretion system inner membrane protein GspF n=1 Tax=Oceaniserpentilla sp. 4NH20-0058 TaxID=3127660 RepID=UPI0031050DC4